MENFYAMRDVGPLSPIPFPIRYFVGLIVYSKISRTLHGQGTGRYSVEEIAVLREEAWSALNDIVGKSDVLGSKISYSRWPEEYLTLQVSRSVRQ